MLMLREQRARVRISTALRSLRAQAMLMIAFTVILPLAIRHPGNLLAFTHMPETWNSMVGATCAIFAGLILLRQVAAYPGTNAFGLILPSFAGPYGIVVATMLALRLEYSSIYLMLSFSAALIVGFLLSFWIERSARLRFHVVPYGRTDTLLFMREAEWTLMEAPAIPADPDAMIVADLHFDLAPEWERMLADAALRGHSVYHVKQLRESLTGRVTIEHLSENSFGSLLPNLAYRKVKRLADLIGSILLMPVVLPAMAIIALAIRLDSAGPVFFVQRRQGYRGEPFSMIKFRTMLPEAAPEEHEAAREHAMTRNGDARITRIGRFLRKTRLDELPQVINVIRGEMSLIGPRPEAVPLSQWYESELPFYSYRHIVRPGMSGWAQVHQGHVTDLEAVHEKLTYDFYYIKNFSAWLDILIAIRTARVMLSGFGSR